MTNDDLDLQRLGEIGDPFADAVSAPLPPLDSARVAARAPAGPTRFRARILRLLALVGAVAVQGLWLLKERRADLGSSPSFQVALGLLIPLAAAAIALAAAVRTGRRGLGLPLAQIALLVAVAPALFALATLGAAPAGEADRFWLRVAGCGVATTILAAVPLCLALWAFRSSFAGAAVWRTAALGVAAGGLAAATMSLACPITTAGHVIVGHGVTMLLAGLAGALAAPAISRS